MAADFYVQGLNILELQGECFGTKWHLEFNIFLRRFEDPRFTDQYMQGQEDVYTYNFTLCVCVCVPSHIFARMM